jgi:Leucine-rich repeat (LRR) protein
LNANNFTGIIPPSLGKLSKLIWLDLADNQLSGSLPISAKDGWGLDLLLKAKNMSVPLNHIFYFLININQPVGRKA